MELNDMILVSVDDHIVEPGDMFQQHMTKAELEKAPKLIKSPEGVEYWTFEDKVLPEVEGEKCARLLAEAGFASISQPGCKHSEPLIVDRYADLKCSGVRYVAYLADNDDTGRKKAEACARAAASVGLSFIVIDLVELFPDLPEGGSIDDVPDIREAMQVIADALLETIQAELDQVRRDQETRIDQARREEEAKREESLKQYAASRKVLEEAKRLERQK